MPFPHFRAETKLTTPIPSRDRPVAAPDDSRMAGKLAAAFTALLVATVCLMTLGALVRAHEAGLACPDWPLCFGPFVPAMDVKVAFEYSHRALAGSISLISVASPVKSTKKPRCSSVTGEYLKAITGPWKLTRIYLE